MSCFSSHSIRRHNEGGYTLRDFTNLRPKHILGSGIIIHWHTLLVRNSIIKYLRENLPFCRSSSGSSSVSLNSVWDSGQQAARSNVLNGVTFEQGTNSRCERPAISRSAFLSPATGAPVSERPRQKMKGAVEKFPAPGQHLGNPNVSCRSANGVADRVYESD